MEKQNDKPLKILQRHEPAFLFRQVRGKQTNSGNLLTMFNFYLMESTDLSYNTRLSYCHQIKKLLDHIEFFKPKLRCKDIENFLKKKRINSHSAVKKFLSFIEEEYNMRFIQVKYPKVKKSEKKVIEILSEKEVKKIIKKMPGKYRFYTAFLYNTGCRISEPFRLKGSSINWNEANKDKTKHALLKISNSKSKRERFIPISPEFTKKIYNYMKRNSEKKELLDEVYIFDLGQEEYLRKKEKQSIKLKIGFGLSITDNEKEELRKNRAWSLFIKNESTKFQFAFRKASFEVLKKYYSPHVLRRSRATSMLNKGMTIMEIRDYLGHADISTTTAYLTISTQQLSDKMKKLGL